MARPKKISQVPVVEQEKVIIEQPVKNIDNIEQKRIPIIIPNDNNAVTRRSPSMDNQYIAGNLKAGYAYEIDRIVHSVIYGDFYLLKNGLYVTKIGNYTVRE